MLVFGRIAALVYAVGLIDNGLSVIVVNEPMLTTPLAAADAVGVFRLASWALEAFGEKLKPVLLRFVCADYLCAASSS